MKSSVSNSFCSESVFASTFIMPPMLWFANASSCAADSFFIELRGMNFMRKWENLDLGSRYAKALNHSCISSPHCTMSFAAIGTNIPFSTVLSCSISMILVPTRELKFSLPTKCPIVTFRLCVRIHQFRVRYRRVDLSLQTQHPRTW